MTNAEKFEEVFGIKIDEGYPADLCNTADYKYCVNANSCHDCVLFHFWDKEYDENTNYVKGKKER